MERTKVINELIMEKFNLKLTQQSESWVEYTDGLKILFIDKDCFHYYFKSTEFAVPITADIVFLVNLIRKEILKVKQPICTVFQDLDKKVDSLNGEY